MSELYCVEKRYHVMGGEFAFMCYPQNFHTKDEVSDAFDRAYQEAKRIENKLTDFKDSQFNRINELAGIKPCVVDDEIFDLIKRSIEISVSSEGLFDITYASVGHHWRDARAAGNILSLDERQELLQWVDYKKIQLDEKKKTIYLPNSNIKIGLGGIGKGYAVDSCFNLLKKCGLYNFYINGSGDIRVHSRPDAPRLWKIGIRNPLSSDSSKSVGVVQLANGAVASSGDYVQFVKNADQSSDHHIINPLTGTSTGEIISSTIIGDTCLESDTTATIVMNMDVASAQKYFKKMNTFGVVINDEGKSFLSDKALASFGM